MSKKTLGDFGKIVPSKGGVETASKPSKRKKKSGKRAKTRKPKQKSLKWKLFVLGCKLFAAFMAISFIFGFLLVAIYAHDLPDVDKLYKSRLKPSITVLDRNGDVVSTYGDLFTEFIQFEDMPKSLVDAVTATEDRRFFDHFGIDPRGMARAMVMNAIRGRVAQGGSTITQQLAKIIFLKPERNIKRKIQEAMLALWLEHKFSKEQILTMYLNRVYLGSGAYGIDAASRTYFNKSAKNLSLYESAMIAGLLKAPTTYSPNTSPKAAVERTKVVLTNMVNAEKISEFERNRALMSAAKIKIETKRENTKYFGDYIADEIQQYIGEVNDHLVVKTTLDKTMQKYADDAITQNILASGEAYNAHQAAIVVMKPDGAIQAMVGGVDYSDSQFNRATKAKRQPGSLFKMFVYTAAIEDGFNPDSEIEDAPISIGKWHPTNYDGKYNGVVTLSYAFANSLNVASVRLGQLVGIDEVTKLAKAMGIKSKLQDTPSLFLGSSEVRLIEMVAAFAHFPNQGRAVHPYAITEIKNNQGNLIYQRKGDYDMQVIDEDTVQKMNEIMMGVVTSGTARAAQIGRDVAGKTGTSQDFRDAWFVGYTPQLVAGVWVGNDDNKPMKKVTGGNLPARIWASFMKPATKNMPVQNLDINYSKGFGDDIKNFWDGLTTDESE